ncbi:hypothetical protein LV84_01261 [Algoriphagus ratkowskyi]|uniref:Uncharacterized protein n=1 Tax=Algoriphagus ratkowskyi TaxID=57028 RepID=A0A2W7RGD9_9BACT|nr:hypothetical protein LV84_01261 [Algoriphagus ratkowskyi]
MVKTSILSASDTRYHSSSLIRKENKATDMIADIQITLSFLYSNEA